MPPARQNTTAHIIPYIDPINPQWDSSPITKGLWVAALEEHLFTTDRRFRTIVEKGVVLEKSHCYTVSSRHSVVRTEKLDDRSFSFTNPSPLDPVASLRGHDPTKAGTIDSFLDANGKHLASIDIGVLPMPIRSKSSTHHSSMRSWPR